MRTLFFGEKLLSGTVSQKLHSLSGFCMNFWRRSPLFSVQLRRLSSSTCFLCESDYCTSKFLSVTCNAPHKYFSFLNVFNRPLRPPLSAHLCSFGYLYFTSLSETTSTRTTCTRLSITLSYSLRDTYRHEVTETLANRLQQLYFQSVFEIWIKQILPCYLLCETNR